MDHLSRLEGPISEVQINDNFPDEQLLAVSEVSLVPWFADYVNYLVAKVIPPEFTYQQKKKFFSELKHYYWEEPILYRHCVDQVIRRCVPEEEMGSILQGCPSLKSCPHGRIPLIPHHDYQGSFHTICIYFYIFFPHIIADTDVLSLGNITFWITPRVSYTHVQQNFSDHTAGLLHPCSWLVT